MTSLIVVVMNSSAIDQYLANHPGYFFGSSPEHGIINPDNLFILTAHIKCGAFELPFDVEEKYGELNIQPVLQYLDHERILRQKSGRYYYSSDRYPAEEVSLRTADPTNFVILNVSKNNLVLGEVDYASAPEMIYEEAVYIHQTQTFLIERLDWELRKAYAREADLDYYTDAVTKRDIRVLAANLESEVQFSPSVNEMDTGHACLQSALSNFDEDRNKDIETRSAEIETRLNESREKILTLPTRDVDNVIYLRHEETPPMVRLDLLAKHYWGEVSVTTLVTKYKKIRFETHENVGYGEVHLPEQELQTEAYWISFEEWLESHLATRGMNLSSAIRALASALASVAPLHVMCDPRDLRTVPMVKSPFVQKPTIYLYDYYPGGIGISHKVFDLQDKIWSSVYALIDECRCDKGCPSCVGPPVEIGSNAKPSAMMVLRELAGALSRSTSTTIPAPKSEGEDFL
jgi:DEAD/DEAH box helicase domain-containing protein